MDAATIKYIHMKEIMYHNVAATKMDMRGTVFRNASVTACGEHVRHD